MIRGMRWTARIWSILIIAYALLMLSGYAWNWITTGTADPHTADDYPFIENLPPLFFFLSILSLGIAWKREVLGGVISVAFLLASLPILLVHWPVTERFPRYLLAPYGIWLIILIPGILFLICWWRCRKKLLNQ
jgi:tryptophan-rich sensory protein